MRAALRETETNFGPGTKVPTCPVGAEGFSRGTAGIGERRGSRAESAVKRLLFVPDSSEKGGCPVADDATTYKIFHVSIAVSALRCLLSYVVFPILTPLLGAATNAGPVIGLPIGVVALCFDVMGIRRFWLSDHRWKWPMTGLYAAVMSLVSVLLVGDIVHLA